MKSSTYSYSNLGIDIDFTNLQLHFITTTNRYVSKAKFIHLLSQLLILQLHSQMRKLFSSNDSTCIFYDFFGYFYI